MKLKLSIVLLLFVAGAKAQTISKAQQDSIKQQKRENAFHKDWANNMRYQAANQQLILIMEPLAEKAIAEAMKK